LKYRDTFLTKKDFILPLFLTEGVDVESEIPSMPEVFHFSIDRVLPYLKGLIELGLKSVLIFGVPERKGLEGALSGIVQKSVVAIKKNFPQLEVITDVCLCAYTEDGQCHIGDNDKTAKLLADIALSHAESGADIVAPSDMMDGRVYYIREKLNGSGFNNVGILSYAAKYSSSYYGPFRDATDCAPKGGDRKSYQMDYSVKDEAIEEVLADISEGANQIMIKPALSYLDIIYKVKEQIDLPVVGYNVSGEYKMIYESVKQGWASEDIINETIVAFKRAGCDRIVSYFTPYFLESLNE
jgi:porphobilinogen synthase